VADNLLRVVSYEGAPADAGDLAARLRNLIEGCRDGVINRAELSAEFAPRERSLADFISAAAAVMDPEKLALAYAFAPDEWRGESLPAGQDSCWPMRNANWYLLYAEGGGRAEVSAAELLAQALQTWDQAELAREQLQSANARAFMLTGFGTDSSKLLASAARELGLLVDRCIDSLGTQIGLGELVLLEQIQRLNWIPRPDLTANKELTGSFPLLRLITEFLTQSQALMEREDFDSVGLAGEEERVALVSAAAQSKLACRGLADNELLQPAPDITQELNTRYAMLGLILALRNRAWREAEQLVQGVNRDRMRPEPDESLRQSLCFGVRAIPLIAGHFREANPQIYSTLEGLREAFPLVGPLIGEFVEAVRSATPAKPVEIPAPPPAPVVAAVVEDEEPLVAIVSEETAPVDLAEPKFETPAPAPVAQPIEVIVEAPSMTVARQTPRLDAEPRQRVQPGILVSALGWDSPVENEADAPLNQAASALPKDVEVLKEVTMPSIADESTAPTAPVEIVPPVARDGKLQGPRKTNRFKVISPLFGGEKKEREKVAATTVEPVKPVEEAKVEAPEPKRRVLAKLAEPEPEPTVTAPAPDFASGDTLRGRPIPVPPPDVKVLPGTPLHQTPLIHGYAAKTRRREKALDCLPGQKPVETPLLKAPEPIAKSAPAPIEEAAPVPAAAGEMPAAIPIAPISNNQRPQAGKRLRGKREAQLSPGHGRRGTEPEPLLMAGLPSRGRMLAKSLATTGVILALAAAGVMAWKFGPEFLKEKFPTLVEEATGHGISETAKSAPKNAVEPSGNPDPAEAPAPADSRPLVSNPAAAAVVAPVQEARRIAREVFAPTEPLKNFIQGRNSIIQPPEVRVLSGDLGASGQPLETQPAEALSTKEVLHRMSDTENAWVDPAPTSQPLSVIAQPEPEAEAPPAPKPAAKPAKKPEIPPALALFDEGPEFDIATDSGREAVFEPIRAADDEEKPEAKHAVAKVAPEAPKKSEGIAPKFAVKGIVYYALGGKDDVKAAMINDWVYQEGEEVLDFSTGHKRAYKVLRIQPESVVLKGEEGEINLPFAKHARL
jgi:hypothetical protein